MFVNGTKVKLKTRMASAEGCFEPESVLVVGQGVSEATANTLIQAKAATIVSGGYEKAPEMVSREPETAVAPVSQNAAKGKAGKR